MSPPTLANESEVARLLAEKDAEIARFSAELAEEKAKNEALRLANAELRATVEELMKEVRLLRAEVKRLRGGSGAGHRIDQGQGTLFGEAPPLPTDVVAPSEHAKEAPDGETPGDPIKKHHKPKRPARKIDTSLLPREQVRHELPEDQRVCEKTGVLLVPVGTKVSEEIDYTPGRLRVIEHHQVEYGPAPEVAKERQIDAVLAPRPPQPLEGCAVSAGLLAHLLVMKYRFHLPLYRQEELFQQAGLRIPRQTLCDWVMKSAFELRPIVDALMRLIRAGPVLHLDDTPIRCQAGKGSSHFQAYLWTFCNPAVVGVVYRFAPGRSAANLAPLLDGVTAKFLLGDGYKGNAAAAREAGLEIALAGCWAHVIRGFQDAEKEARKMSKLFQQDIRALYDIEEDATKRGLDDADRVKLRRAEARPILARMLRRTRGWEELFSTKGKMAEAIKYLRNGWKTLKTFLLDGRVGLDNNICERSIRPVAIGRKNWLFAGSLRGGEAAAIVYSLIESCRLAGVEPWEYLRDVLVRVATHPASRVDELIPARWKKLTADSAR